MASREIEGLIQLLARLPGLGPRSARRAALHLMKKRESLMVPLASALKRAAEALKVCGTCGNLDTSDPCALCQDVRRDPSILCVVEEVGDLWALERAGAFKGLYHVLGGTLSAIDGRGPQQLNVDSLIRRARAAELQEVVLALSATVDGQTTAHYLSERLATCGVTVTRPAHGLHQGRSPCIQSR
jgi:recombination protein RecR